MPGRSGSRRSDLTVRRALARLGEALAHELAGRADRPATWPARLEPRAKIAGIALLIFGTTFLHGLAPLGAMLAGAVILALSGGAGPARIGRLWLGVPLFSAAIVLPAMLNVVTDGPAVATLWRIGPQHGRLPEVIAVTGPGLVVAARFLLRCLDCVTLAFVLIATTEQAELVNGLRRLGMPRAFGMVLSMTQRYLETLLRAAEEIHLAKLSRPASGEIRSEHRWLAAGIGSLFRRTRHLAEEVHEAMISRGYDGETRAPSHGRMRLPDAVWLIGSAAFLLGLLLADRSPL